MQNLIARLLRPAKGQTYDVLLLCSSKEIYSRAARRSLKRETISPENSCRMPKTDKTSFDDRRRLTAKYLVLLQQVICSFVLKSLNYT